jgi:hypothetical protein
MRHLLTSLIAGIALVLCAGESQAQYPSGLYSRGYWTAPTPYYPGPPVYGYSAFASPYGYQTYSSYKVLPGPFGYNATYSTGTSVQPYVNSPYHSIYWDPFANSYRYSSGYLNTPSYYYFSGYPYYPYPY